MPNSTLYKAIIGFSGKAYRVAITDIGFKIGAASIKVIAIGIATPFFIRPVIIGTVAHSHTGSTNPPKIAVKNPSPYLFGKAFIIKLAEIKTCRIEDMSIPKSINGKACRRVLKKTVLAAIIKLFIN